MDCLVHACLPSCRPVLSTMEPWAVQNRRLLANASFDYSLCKREVCLSPAVSPPCVSPKEMQLPAYYSQLSIAATSLPRY